MNLHFVIPEIHSFVSGGNIYNARLIQNLAECGHKIIQNPQLPESTDGETVLIYDSIFLDALQNHSPASDSILLVHHLPSLFPFSEKRFEEKERNVLSRFAGFIVTSDFTATYLVSKGFSPDQICIAEPAAEVPAMMPSVQPGKVQALVIANLVPRKGVLAFLQALTDLPIQPFFRLRLVGNADFDKSYAQDCLTLIRENPILARCVSFLGVQDTTGMERLWRKTNLFVSASRMETFGMAIQEAAIRHIPVLARKGGHIAAHFKSVGIGLLAENTEELARHFVRITNDQTFFRALVQKASLASSVYLTDWKSTAVLVEQFLKEFSQSRIKNR